MKFIFPQNYNFKNKLFGFIDYSTVFVDIIWCCFIFFFINIIFSSLNIKIFCFIILCFPIILLSISGLNGENFVYVFCYMIRFSFKQKIIFFK